MIKIFPGIHIFCGDDSDQTRALLTSAAYVHLKQGDLSKYTRNLSPASRAILLSGPAGKSFTLCMENAKKYGIMVQFVGNHPKDLSF